jgi:hypothetical protein
MGEKTLDEDKLVPAALPSMEGGGGWRAPRNNAYGEKERGVRLTHAMDKARGGGTTRNPSHNVPTFFRGGQSTRRWLMNSTNTDFFKEKLALET